MWDIILLQTQIFMIQIFVTMMRFLPETHESFRYFIDINDYCFGVLLHSYIRTSLFVHGYIYWSSVSMGRCFFQSDIFVFFLQPLFSRLDFFMGFFVLSFLHFLFECILHLFLW